MFDDDQETPNTQVATLEFNGAGKRKLMVFEVRHWMTNGEATVGGRGAAGNAIGNLFYGSKGYMSFAGGYQTFLGKEQQPGPKWEGKGRGEGEGGHFGNFIAAMRSRKPSDLNAEIEEGAVSTVLMHLANISYRLGRTLDFDPETLTCKDAEATKLFTRAYRKPFVVPEKV
jgi:hypothetical protein